MTRALVAIGREIRRLRTARGYSLTELGAAAHLEPNYISGIEGGKRNPSVLVVLRISDALNVHPGDLFGGFDDLSGAAVEAGRIIDALPDPVREAALVLLRAFDPRTVEAAKEDATHIGLEMTRGRGGSS